MKACLSTLSWIFSQGKGCGKVGAENMYLKHCLVSNHTLKVLIKKLGHEKVKVPADVMKVGSGILPTKDAKIAVLLKGQLVMDKMAGSSIKLAATPWG